MSNNIEWVSADHEAPTITSAYDLHISDPDDERLNPEYDRWGYAIFAGDVAIYAATPHSLRVWLKSVLADLDTYCNDDDAATSYLVASTGGIEEPSFQSFDNPSQAVWRYRELADDLRPGEYGDRVDLLHIAGDTTLCVDSTTAADNDDED